MRSFVFSIHSFEHSLVHKLVLFKTWTFKIEKKKQIRHLHLYLVIINIQLVWQKIKQGVLQAFLQRDHQSITIVCLVMNLTGTKFNRYLSKMCSELPPTFTNSKKSEIFA